MIPSPDIKKVGSVHSRSQAEWKVNKISSNRKGKGFCDNYVPQ